MSSVKGKVGQHELEWLSAPHGKDGQSQVKFADGTVWEVRWKKDAEGLWIELPHTVAGFDIGAEAQDEGNLTYRLRRRSSNEAAQGLSFLRAGAGEGVSAAGAKKKGVRVRAQMPGKIVRILVQPGAEVERGQPLLVMEAMKMENEIRASQAGKVVAVKVSEGQAVETGADLMNLE